MNLGDLLNFLNSLFGALFDASGNSELMPGSAFHSMVAAFATQGYWAHADMLYMIGATKFQHFAVLIYMFAIIGGICGMALGAPPKMYLWFILGPGVFHFLLGTTQPVLGVAWKVAGVPQNQEEVWKLAEIGVGNSYITERLGISVNAYQPPSGGPNGNGTVEVSYIFAQFDGLVSDTVQSLISWLGIYRMKGGDLDTSNRVSIPTNVKEESKWYLLSNLKWGILDTITSARFKTVELRDALNTFMASKCGDAFFDSVEPSRYALAKRITSGVPPPGVFKRDTKLDGNGNPISFGSSPKDDYEVLDSSLAQTSTYMPRSLIKLLTPNPSNTYNDPDLDPGDFGASYIPQQGSFLNAFWAPNDYTFKGVISQNAATTEDGKKIEELMRRAQISCRNYLDILVRGLRWEAGHIYGQLAQELPLGMKSPNLLNYAMLYGWDIRKLNNGTDLWKLAFDEKALANPSQSGYQSTKLSTTVDGDGSSQQQQYMVDLIFINLVKNEFQIAYNKLESKFSKTSTQSATEAVEQYQKTVGSRNKFGEVYTWALMMPYMQGTLLYLLAIGYPFACMFVLLPGWHKIIFTWASFWVWAKIWDVGFAIVAILERSIWATIGNSSRASQMNPFIADMLNFGKTVVKSYPSNPIPNVFFKDSVVNPIDGQYASYQYLDRAMSMFGSMDLDLQNSYYIYIMAALYFAVPAVTGQLVLGAKAGVAGLVTNAFTQMSQETGSKAGAAFTAGLQKAVEANSQSVDQAFLAKNLANRGLLAKALDTQNRAQDGTLAAQYLSQFGDGIGAKSGMLDMVGKRRQGDSEYAHFMMKNALSHPAEMLKASVIMGTALGNIPRDVVRAADGNQTRGVNIPGAANGYSTGRAGQGSTNDFTASDPSVQGGFVPPGGPTTGTVNPSGGPRTGEVRFRGFLDGAKDMIMQNYYGPLGFAVDSSGKMQGYAIQRDVTDQQAGLSAARTEFGIQSYEQRADADRLNAHGQRLMAFAQGDAQGSAWYEKADYATTATPLLAAMGVQGPSIGPKPTDSMYMAMEGLAGTSAQEKANHFKDGGSFQQSIAGYANDLYSNFGKDQLYDGIYKAGVSSPIGELRQGVQRFGDLSERGIDLFKDVGKDIYTSLTDPSKAPGAAATIGKAAGGFITLTEGYVGPGSIDRNNNVVIDRQPSNQPIQPYGGATIPTAKVTAPVKAKRDKGK